VITGLIEILHMADLTGFEPPRFQFAPEEGTEDSDGMESVRICLRCVMSSHVQYMHSEHTAREYLTLLSDGHSVAG
jgi:hypothetical protein